MLATALMVLSAPLLLFPRGWWPALALLALPVCVRRIPAAPAWGPALWLLLAAAAVSAWYAASIESAVPKVLGLALGVLVVRTALVVNSVDAARPWLVPGFIAAGAGLAGATVLGTNWIDKWVGISAVARMLPEVLRGLPGAPDGFHPNAAAGVLILFVPAAWAEARRGPTYLAAAMLMTMTLALTQSRGALAGLAVGGLVWALASHRVRRTRRRILAGAVLATCAASLVLAQPALRDRWAGLHLSDGAVSRIELWRESVQFVLKHPLVGTGFNGFRRSVQTEQPLFLIEVGRDLPHAHNLILQTAADIGIAGAAVLATLLGCLLVQLRRQATETRLAGALLAGLVAHLVFNLTDAIPLGSKAGLAFWTFVAVVATVCGQGPGGAARTDRPDCDCGRVD